MYRLSRRTALFAAGASMLALAACDETPEDEGSKDLDGNRAGAMESYKVGDQFKASEALSFSILYNNHPSYALKEDWLFWSELTKRTNVKLEPVAVPLSDYEAKRSLLIGAGDAPFIIPKTYHPQEDAFVSSGAILPVSDYIDLMPNLKEQITKWNLEPDLGAWRQEDGKYYLLPGTHEEVWQDYSLAVRTDILQQLGLSIPKTWDEFHTMLKAMKQAHPDVYPLSDRWSTPPQPGGNNLLQLVAIAYGSKAGWGFQHANWDPKAKKFVYTGAQVLFRSLNRGDQIGSLEQGKLADFVIHDCEDYRELAYFFGIEHPWRTYAGGIMVYERSLPDPQARVVLIT